MRKIPCIVLSAILFLVIFNPPFTINVVRLGYVVMGIFTLLYLLPNIKQIINADYKQYVPVILQILWLTVAAFLPVCLNCVLSNGSVVSIMVYVRGLRKFSIDFVLVLIYLLNFYFYSKKHKINRIDFTKALIWAGVYEALIALLAFVNPIVHRYLVSIIVNNTGYVEVYPGGLSAVINIMKNRAYGFSSGMFSDLSVIMALFSILSMYLVKKGLKKYIFSVILCAFASVINGRMGVVVLFLGLIFVGFPERINGKVLVKHIFYCFVACCSALTGVYFVSKYAFRRIVSCYINLYQVVLYGADTTLSRDSANVLFSEVFWRLPAKCYQIIFGIGIPNNPRNISYIGYSSDIGLIWVMHNIGFIGLFLLISFYIYIAFFLLKRVEDCDDKRLIIFLFVTLLLINCKDAYYGFNPVVLLISYITLALVYLPKQYKKVV